MRDAIQRMRIERRLALVIAAVVLLAACVLYGVAAPRGADAGSPKAPTPELHP